MRRYVTWRCIGLHVLVVVLVPGFLVAGWWQYHVALGGNDLSWVYTVEWPFFAVYAVYIWWKLIHDESTPFDRLWAAKQRAAADSEGKPLHEIPGWATDKTLSRAVYRSSRDAARHPALAGSRLETIDLPRRQPASLMPAGLERTQEVDAPSTTSGAAGDDDPANRAGGVIDAQVLEVKSNVDGEMDAYNRYLFELSRNGAPKRRSSGRGRSSGRRHGDPPDVHRAPGTVPEGERPALGPTNGQ